MDCARLVVSRMTFGPPMTFRQTVWNIISVASWQEDLVLYGSVIILERIPKRTDKANEITKRTDKGTTALGGGYKHGFLQVTRYSKDEPYHLSFCRSLDLAWQVYLCCCSVLFGPCYRRV